MHLMDSRVKLRLETQCEKMHENGCADQGILPPVQRPNERWSMDFASDSIVIGLRFQALAIVGEPLIKGKFIEI